MGRCLFDCWKQCTRTDVCRVPELPGTATFKRAFPFDHEFCRPAAGEVQVRQTWEIGEYGIGSVMWSRWYFCGCCRVNKAPATIRAWSGPVCDTVTWHLCSSIRTILVCSRLHCQGLWKDHFGSTTWKQLLQDERFCQDLAGNSFSSTVFQSVFLSSLVAFPTSWNAIASTSEASGTGNQEGNQVAPKDVLRRIMRKRKAPEYDTVQNVQKPTKRAPRSRGQHKYNRKVPGIDSRKHKKEGQGKQHVLSIWEKEQVYLGCLYTNSIWWLCVFL